MVGPLDLYAGKLRRDAATSSGAAPARAPPPPLGRSRRLYEDVGERLGEFVRESSMQPGDQFPAERELAQRLQVSRTTVRQSFVVLQALGFVDVRQGEGV